MRRGYTLLEVLVAAVILGILAVPLAYQIKAGFDGSTRARREDECLALAHDEWAAVRECPADSLRDTVYERSVSGHPWRLERDVFDSLDRARAGLASLPKAAGYRPPVEISLCAVSLSDGREDTVRCFRWMRPRMVETK